MYKYQSLSLSILLCDLLSAFVGSCTYEEDFSRSYLLSPCCRNSFFFSFVNENLYFRIEKKKSHLDPARSPDGQAARYTDVRFPFISIELLKEEK